MNGLAPADDVSRPRCRLIAARFQEHDELEKQPGQGDEQQHGKNDGSIHGCLSMQRRNTDADNFSQRGVSEL
jgi:hypothetical protein